MDWIKDAIEDMTNGIAEGLTKLFLNILFKAFYEPLKFFFDLLDVILVDPNDIMSDYVSNASVLINSLITTLALCIFAFKIVHVMKRNAEGTAETPMYYVSQLLPASLLVAVLPWLVDILTKISFAGSRALMDVGEKSYLTTISEWKDLEGAKKGFAEMTKVLGATAGSIPMLILFGVALLIFTIIFIFQFASRIADLIVMKLVAPLVAVSMLADQNSYLDVWWKELVAISIQLPLQMFTFFGGINLIFGAKLDAPTLLLGFGLMIVTVKSPSFIRSMAYSTGSGRMATMAGMTATRMFAQRIFMK